MVLIFVKFIRPSSKIPFDCEKEEESGDDEGENELFPPFINRPSSGPTLWIMFERV